MKKYTYCAEFETREGELKVRYFLKLEGVIGAAMVNGWSIKRVCRLYENADGSVKTRDDLLAWGDDHLEGYEWTNRY